MSGVFRYELDLLAETNAPDGAGGVARSFQPQSTIWAGVEYLPSVNGVSGDARARLKRIKALVRARSDLAIGARVRFQGADFEISSIESDDERGRRLFLICEEALS
ncbi:MAG: head-tail adaptor protein [Parvularculaceae bacterium]